jgi:hypothetical protein
VGADGHRLSLKQERTSNCETDCSITNWPRVFPESGRCRSNTLREAGEGQTPWILRPRSRAVLLAECKVGWWVRIQPPTPATSPASTVCRMRAGNRPLMDAPRRSRTSSSERPYRLRLRRSDLVGPLSCRQGNIAVRDRPRLLATRLTAA